MCIRDSSWLERVDEDEEQDEATSPSPFRQIREERAVYQACLLYTSDAADERSSVDLGGRRIIKKKTSI